MRDGGNDTTPTALLAAATELDRSIQTLEAQRAVLLERIDANGWADAECGHHTGTWHATRTNRDPKATRRLVRITKVLHRSFPRMLAAWTDGPITLDHATLLEQVCNKRIEAKLADLDAELVRRADEFHFHAWEQWLRQLAHLTDLDGGFDPSLDPNANHLSLSAALDGIVHVAGSATAQVAARIKKAVDKQAARLRGQYTTDAEHHPDIEIPTNAALRMLALADICDEWLAGQHATGASNTEVVVTITNEELDTVIARLGHHGCTASFRGAVFTTDGVPLKLGRSKRYFTDEQRRIINARDGGCTFDGCDTPAEDCDIHHVEHFNPDGPTDVDNGALLCKHHHRSVTHRPGWTMNIDRRPNGQPTGRFTWTTPTGRTIHSQHHGQRHHQHTNPPTT